MDDNNAPVCPFCGAEADNFYINKNREVVGCDICLSTLAWWEEELHERLQVQVQQRGGA